MLHGKTLFVSENLISMRNILLKYSKEDVIKQESISSRYIEIFELTSYIYICSNTNSEDMKAGRQVHFSSYNIDICFVWLIQR